MLLDEESDTTLLQEGLLNRLALERTNQQLEVVGITGTSGRYQSKRASVRIQTQERETIDKEAS